MNLSQAIHIINDRAYALGKAVAQEEIAYGFRKEAGELFSHGKRDDQARFMRDLATRLEAEAKLMRKEIDKGQAESDEAHRLWTEQEKRESERARLSD